MFLPWQLFESDEARRRRLEHEKTKRERRLMECVPWNPKTSWTRELNIQAKTYKMPSLFEVEPVTHKNVNSDKKSQQARSANEKYVYRERVLKRGVTLDTYCGNQIGDVLFDGDIKIPMIFDYHPKLNSYREEPWMSFTPMEVFTLRPGTKKAKGHVIVAGLGMGYQLQEVCAKRSVHKVTLVEVDRELVDWIFPLCDTHGKDVDVVIGDAKKLVPKMEADVALIDIYRTYGNNGDEMQYYLRKHRSKIDTVWIWGAAKI